VTFDRARLVIQSGTSQTIVYTVTNRGGTRGQFGFLPDCVHQSVGAADQSSSHPVAWPAPVDLSPICTSIGIAQVGPHDSRALRVTVAAGLIDGSGNLVPSPPGPASFPVKNLGSGGGGAQLPVTITPPATPPLTIDHPSQVTTASGAQNEVDFTITNNLPFPVAFVDQGPCAHGGEAACARTFPHSARDLRLAPYDNADVPLWTTRFVLGAHETRMATASVNGVANLGGNSSSSPALPPGGYHFDWDGEKVAFTVT
jgi:hypothetical protein